MLQGYLMEEYPMSLWGQRIFNAPPLSLFFFFFSSAPHKYVGSPFNVKAWIECMKTGAYDLVLLLEMKISNTHTSLMRFLSIPPRALTEASDDVSGCTI